MDRIRCIIVDDEPLSKMLLEGYVKQTANLELAESFVSSSEAYKAMQRGDVDIAFLDIQMPGFSGLQLAKIAEKSGIKVVFTTAHPNYALEGFRVNAVDYLLKPISREDFRKGAKRAMDLVELDRVATRLTESQSSGVDQITVRSNYRNLQINTADIVFIEGVRDYVKFHLKGEEQSVITQMNLKDLEERLPGGMFVRVHRSYIIGLDYVRSYSKSSVEMAVNGDETVTVPVGQTFRDKFLERISK